MKGYKFRMKEQRKRDRRATNGYKDGNWVVQSPPVKDYEKRNELGALQGSPKTFTATLAAFGKNYKPGEGPTVLVRRVTHNGRVVTDHLWLRGDNILDDFGQFIEGDVVQFVAQVSAYLKGRSGDVNNPQRMDYALAKPTNVRLVASQDAKVLTHETVK